MGGRRLGKRGGLGGMGGRSRSMQSGVLRRVGQPHSGIGILYALTENLGNGGNGGLENNEQHVVIQ